MAMIIVKSMIHTQQRIAKILQIYRQIVCILMIAYVVMFTDINECQLSNNCVNPEYGGICENTNGTYTCSCKTGFSDIFGNGTVCNGKTFTFFPHNHYIPHTYKSSME